MLSKITRILNVTVVCCIVFMLSFMAISVNCDDAMSMKPDRINLNSVSVMDNYITALFGVSGWDVPVDGSWHSELVLENGDGKILEFTTRREFFYCTVDDILHVYFDKQEVQDDITGADWEEGTVSAEVTFVMYDSDGDVDLSLSGSDDIEILKPGKSGK